MATSHVQTKDGQTASGTTLAIPLSGVVAGNHLSACTMTWNAGVITAQVPTSSPAATWAAYVPQFGNATSGGTRVDYSESVASGAWTVTLHAATAASQLTGFVNESSGVATSASIGAAGTTHAQAAGSATILPGSLTPTAGSILYTYVSDNGSSSTTDTINSSFLVSSDATSWNATNLRAGAAHLDNVAATATNPTWTVPAGTPAQMACLVEYLAAGAATSPFPLPRPWIARPWSRPVLAR